MGSENMSKGEKYGLIIIGVVLLIVLIVSSVLSVKTPESKELSNDADQIYANAQEESSSVKDSEKAEFAYIDISQYFDMYHGSEKQIVLIARPSCQYCQIAEPILQKLAKDYNLKINYLDTDEFGENDQQTLIDSNEAFKNLGTPMLLVVSDDQIHDSVNGLTDAAHYIEFFKTNGYIG